jgi:hypothetical protein
MPIDAETSRRCVRVRNKFTEKNEDSSELPHHGAPLRDAVRACDARSFGVGDGPFRSRYPVRLRGTREMVRAD